MEAAPVKPAPPAQRPPRAAPAAAKRPAAATAAAHAGGAHAAAPATPNDFEALARQSAFDAIAASRAEAQREMNILRDLAMQQVKRDDANVGNWIKLI